MRFNRKKLIQKSWERNSYVPVRIRKEVLKRDNSICVFCELENVRSLCHIIPYSRGGDDSPENLVVCCKGCQQKKKYQLPLEFFFDGFLWDYEFEDREEGTLTREKEDILKSISGLLKGIIGLQRDIQGYFERGQGQSLMKDIEEYLEVKK